VVLPGSARWEQLAPSFPRTADLATELTSQRAIIVVELERVSDSCGYSVPEMTLTGERDVLDRWASARTAGELDDYRAEKNVVSIDGLRALEPARSQ
jgi:hypothetical protein